MQAIDITRFVLAILAIAALVGGCWRIAQAIDDQAHATRQLAFTMYCSTPPLPADDGRKTDCDVELTTLRADITDR